MECLHVYMVTVNTKEPTDFVRVTSCFSHHLVSWSPGKTIGPFLLIVTAFPGVYHWGMSTVCMKDFIFLTTFSSGNISQHVLYCLTFSLNQLGLLRLVHVLQAPKTYNGKLKRFVDNWMRQIVELKKSVFDLMNSFERWKNSGVFSCLLIKAGPPWFEFLVIFDFLHPGIEEVERHLLWKYYKKIRRKSWSNVPPKLLTCIRFLYKVVHKIGRLRKFNRSLEIEFNFLTAWTISIKIGTLVQHAPGHKRLPQIFLNFA